MTLMCFQRFLTAIKLCSHMKNPYVSFDTDPDSVFFYFLETTKDQYDLHRFCESTIKLNNVQHSNNNINIMQIYSSNCSNNQ